MPLPSPEATRELLRSRRTIHEFAPEPPPWTLVETALDSARFAPNHYFTQPWRFYRIGPHTRTAIIQINHRLVSASKGEAAASSKTERWQRVPGWLVITCLRGRRRLQAREDYAACCCAVQNLMLELWSQGVGSKWTTGEATRDPDFLPLLGADAAREDVVALLWYGYPEQVPQSRRKPLAEVLTELP